MKLIGIYKVTSPTGKIYIGQSINIDHRFSQYKNCRSTNAIGPKLYNSLSKYGWDAHKKEIIEECSIEQLNERETYWKKYYLNQMNEDWNKVLFFGLYDNGSGPQSEEIKRRKSLALKGKPMLKNRKKVEKYSIDGILLEDFSSQTEAALSVNSNSSAAISECCKNKRKTHKGFIWKYKL